MLLQTMYNIVSAPMPGNNNLSCNRNQNIDNYFIKEISANLCKGQVEFCKAYYAIIYVISHIFTIYNILKSSGHIAQVSLVEQQRLLEQEIANDDTDFLATSGSI